MIITNNKQLTLKVEIVRLTDESQPGWVECKLVDAWGKIWLFELKVPVVSQQNIDAKSKFPQIGQIACTSEKIWHDQNGRKIVTVNTEKPWDIESKDGTTQFEILTSQLTNHAH